MFYTEIITFITDLISSPILKGHAYLDPGSGSFLLQLLIAGLVGAGFLVKTFWRRIIAFFTGKTQEEIESSAPPTDDEQNDNV